MLSSHWSSQIAVVRNVAARWPVPFSLEAWWMLLGNWSPQRFSEFFDWIFNIQQNGGGFFRSAGDQWDIDDCNDLIVLKRTISMEKKAIDGGLRIDSGSATGRERLRKPLNPPGRFREEGPAEARSTGPHGAAPERFGIGGERGYAIKGGGGGCRTLPPPPGQFLFAHSTGFPVRYLTYGFSADSQRMLSGCCGSLGSFEILVTIRRFFGILFRFPDILLIDTHCFQILRVNSDEIFSLDVLKYLLHHLRSNRFKYLNKAIPVPFQCHSSAIPVPFQCHSNRIRIQIGGY